LKKESKKTRKDSLEDKAELSTEDEGSEGALYTGISDKKRNEE
jgi:hypothetical protein